MDTIWGWLWYALPWEVKAVGAVLLLGLAAYLWRVPPKWLLPIAAILAAAIGYNQAAQSGWRKKSERDMADASRLIEKARKARARADAIPADKLRAPDRYLRDGE